MYDAFETPRAVRGDLPLLDRAQALAYLDDVRERVPARGLVPARAGGPPRGPAPGDDAAGDRAGAPLAGARRAARRAARGARRPHRPRVGRGPGRAVRARRAGGPLRLRQRAPAPPRRAARLPDRPHADHQRDLPALRRGRRLRAPPVVERRGVGLEGGVRHHPPRGLGRRAHGWRRWTFDGWAPLDPDEPVVHVSWFEADAFARAHGARLPTEAEWEKAATWDQEAGPGNLDQGLLGPAPVGAYPEAVAACGALGMLGDVWEWTSSAFRGYDGFVAHPYREYSEVFFGDRYKVLRGGSWATRSRVATPDLPQLGPAPAPADLLRREAGMGRVERAAADRRPRRHGGAARAARRRARRPHEAVQGAAAQAPLRRPRRRAVRPDLRAARVLPDAHRARDPRRATPTRSCAAPRWPSWSSSARARRPRRACCSTRWSAPARCGATCRSTSPSRRCASARPRWPRSTRPGDPRHRRRLRAPPADDPAAASRAARAWSPSSAARSATSRPARGAASCARSPACSRPATTCCWAPTSSRTSTRSRPPTTTRRA